MSQFTNNGSSGAPQNDEINIVDYIRTLRKYYKMIAAIVVAASIIAVVVSLLLPKSYRATALIIPIMDQKSGNASQMASQLGGLAALAGVAISAGADENMKLVAMMESRTVTENVIKKENLMKELFHEQWDPELNTWKPDVEPPLMEFAVVALQEKMGFMPDKTDKTIKISGEFHNPELAARVVNAYIEELQDFMSNNTFTVAKRNRIFLEGQLQENKRDLLESGKEINEFYKTNKISDVEANVDVAIEGFNGNRKNPYADPPNADSPKLAQVTVKTVTDVQTDVGDLLVQKETVEGKLREMKVVEDVPQQVYLTYLLMQRELLSKVNLMLTSQYEMAKIEEAKQDLAFQVIDYAVPPALRFKPKRGQICITAFFMAVFFAIFVAFIREYLKRTKMQEY